MLLCGATARLSALLGLPPEQPSDDGAEERLGSGDPSEPAQSDQYEQRGGTARPTLWHQFCEGNDRSKPLI
jgi:hypothetical protein